MPKKPFKAETVLELTGQEDLLKMSALKLDLHLAAMAGEEQHRESGIPQSTSAKVLAKVGTVKVTVRGKS